MSNSGSGREGYPRGQVEPELVVVAHLGPHRALGKGQTKETLLLMPWVRSLTGRAWNRLAQDRVDSSSWLDPGPCTVHLSWFAGLEGGQGDREAHLSPEGHCLQVVVALPAPRALLSELFPAVHPPV